MILFLRYILKLAFVAGVVYLFFTSCSQHRLCTDEEAGKKKYHSKRYMAALHERDSLCMLAKQRHDEITGLRSEVSGLNSKVSSLENKYNDLLSSSGTELSKLSADLKAREQALGQKESRLRQLESALRKQDSLLTILNNSVKNALLGFSPDELSVEMKNGKVYVSLSDKLLFKSGDASVEKKGKEALQKLAAVLNRNNDVSIDVEGHTDNVPIRTKQYLDNWDLSAARAINVVRLLADDYGMDPQRLTAAGKGEHFPVADNSTPEGKARNRRTEIVLTPKLGELMKLIAAGK